ncbi:hypothetical protein HN011_011106, partial [Eciton burchellii]
QGRNAEDPWTLLATAGRRLLLRDSFVGEGFLHSTFDIVVRRQALRSTGMRCTCCHHREDSASRALVAQERLGCANPARISATMERLRGPSAFGTCSSRAGPARAKRVYRW